MQVLLHKKGKKSYGCQPCLFIRTRRLFPIRIEKSPSMKGRYILIKLTMGMLNTSMIGKRYTQGKLHPKWLMTQILMDRWTGKGGESGRR